jgi:hypothetical protein
MSGTPDDLAEAVQSEIVQYKVALEAAGLLRKDAAK